MSSICYITESQLKSDSRLANFHPVVKPLTIENVATIIETFEFALKEISSNNIKDVLTDNSGYFLFLVDTSKETNFDFYEYLNRNYKDNITINCMNAKWVFPKGLSKGLYLGYVETPVNEDTERTGYLDEEALQEIMGNTSPSLYCKRTETTIPISRDGIVLGRSKNADYCIMGNINISRTHCKIYFQGDTVYVHDCNSSNGTYVNGMRVYPNKDVPMQSNDILMLADEEFSLI